VPLRQGIYGVSGKKKLWKKKSLNDIVILQAAASNRNRHLAIKPRIFLSKKRRSPILVQGQEFR